MTQNAVMRLTLKSECLRGETDVAILYPVKREEKRNFGSITEVKLQKRKEKLQVLYLLHGNEGDSLSWITNTRLALFAKKYPNLMVVMPTIKEFQSFRVGEEEVPDYYQYLAGELPDYIERMFPISQKREDTLIAGVFMGGYLSYRVAMGNSEKYGCVGAVSSPLDIVRDMAAGRYTGSKFMYSSDELNHDLFWDIRAMVENNLEKGVVMPKTFQACGTEDIMYDINCHMKEFFSKRLPDHTYVEAFGSHNWYSADMFLEKLLNWLPLQDKEEK